MAYITQRDLAMLPNTLLIPIKSIIRTPKTVCKFEINSVLCFLRTNMRTTDPAAQGSLFFFSRPEMMRNAVAQQSCRYLTPLLSGAGEKPHSFPASVFINSGSSIKAQGGRYPVQYTHFGFSENTGFRLLGWLWYERGWARTAQHSFQDSMLT